MCPTVLQCHLCMRLQSTDRSPTLSFLQTKRGEPAKRQTSDEFAERVLDVKQLSLASKDKHPEYYKKGGPFYSWDNASFHTSMKLHDVGLSEEDMWLLPPNSPDMHKVIEHVVGRVKRALREELCDNANITTVKQVKHVCKQVFFNRITVESVRKDIDSLPTTYRHIHAKKSQGGREGDWSLAKYR